MPEYLQNPHSDNTNYLLIYKREYRKEWMIEIKSYTKYA